MRGEVMQSFHWTPAGGRRHASAEPHPRGATAYPDGAEVAMLCQRIVSVDNDDSAWLCETCPSCFAAVRVFAGLPPVAGTR